MESLPATNVKYRYRPSTLLETFETISVRAARLFLQVKFLGYSHTLDEYDQRTLRTFNQINFFQLLVGLLVPLLGFLLPGHVPGPVWLVVFAPTIVSIVALLLNAFRKYEMALYAYFILYPFCTCLVYLNGINPGIELYFILFVILSVFFLNDTGFMLFVIAFCMLSFFVLSVVLKEFTYELETASPVIYLLNKLATLGFIFYGLLLVKNKNTVYQYNILSKQKHLAEKNTEIEKQKEELAAMNFFKSKLFSIISHDLKSPVYALRNLFQNMQQFNTPAEDIKAVVPDVLKDLNYTTSLLENMLQWAKSQMQASTVLPQEINARFLLNDVSKVLRLQAEAKKLVIGVQAEEGLTFVADKDMIHLVLRNLLSNAIKFTRPGGALQIGATDCGEAVKLYVRDNGVGITAEALEKIRQKVFYTTHGTGSEAGTGLGLMLCHEFLVKNNSRLQIDSTVGEGSQFSFLLPKEEAELV